MRPKANNTNKINNQYSFLRALPENTANFLKGSNIKFIELFLKNIQVSCAKNPVSGIW